MRRIRKGRAKAQKRLVIFGTFVLLMFFSVGYAAFTTNITLNAKGNLYPSTSVSDLKATVVNSGDGLYVDTSENNRYVYKGSNPNNYLSLNNETWRIVSIESDNSVKIIRESSIGTLPFDLGYSNSVNGITEASSIAGTRYSSSSSNYCYHSDSTSYRGCKVWGSKDTMRDSNGVLLKDTAGGAVLKRYLLAPNDDELPDDDAYINIYLNGGNYASVSVTSWYDTWSVGLSNSIKSKILSNHLWNVGVVESLENGQISDSIGQEKANTWQGRVGLLTASEYVRASGNAHCSNIYNYENDSDCYGSDLNYLPDSMWLGVPVSKNSRGNVWYVSNSLLGSSNLTYNSYNVNPVLYLASTVKFSGDGTSVSKYEIR